MAEILGIGTTHYPGLKYPDGSMVNILKQILESPAVRPELKVIRNWPDSMRKEWGNDEGLSSAALHRARLVRGFKKVRAEIDRFRPDFLLIWGDDQYENFHEDLIPPFCIYLYDEIVTQPYLRGSAITRGRSLVSSIPNVWGEPTDKAWTNKVHREAGSRLVTELVESGFDVSYAYKPLHHPGLSHAFANTLLYLDYERKGFDYPLVPFAVNCYGKDVLTGGKGVTRIMEREAAGDSTLAPPGPTPQRCFEVGAQVRRILEASPWRAAIIGSSSWSHAFLTPTNGWLYPDIEADRRHVEELRSGDQRKWAELSNLEIETAGEHEFRNWICLAGAMADRKAEVVDYLETYIFNSDKCFAIFPES